MIWLTLQVLWILVFAWAVSEAHGFIKSIEEQERE